MAPDGWIATTLGRCLREPIRNGYSPVCPHEFTGKWILHLGAVTPTGFNREAVKPAPLADPKVDASLLEIGDVVVSRSNTRERVGFAGLYRGVPHPCAYPDLLMRVRPNDDLNPQFLEQVLLASRAYFQRVARGTSGSMVKIDRALLEAFPLLLPPLSEQRKIVAILSAVDVTIEKTKEVIEGLLAAKRTLIEGLLASEAWESKALSDLIEADPKSGRSPKSRSEPPGVPTFSIAAVRAGVVEVEPHLKYADVNPDEVARFVLQSGDILMIRGNANPDLVGTCGIVHSVPEGCIYPDILMRIRLKPEVDSAFFVEAWNSSVVRCQIVAKLKTTAGTFKVNQEDLRTTFLPVPPPEEQWLVARISQAANESRLANLAALSALQVLKNTLASALLAGQLRVTPDEVPT